MENIELFGKVMLSCVTGKDLEYYEDGNELSLDLKRLQKNGKIDESVRKMIKKMCYSHGKVGISFNELEEYLANLSKGRDTEQENESPMICSKHSWHGLHKQNCCPLKYKTDESNGNDFENNLEAMNMVKKETVEQNNNEKKIEKRVKKILYQWNHDEKRHDIIHQYEDGTKETKPRDQETKVPEITLTNENLEKIDEEMQSSSKKKNSVRNAIEKLEDLRSRLSGDNIDVGNKPKGGKNESKNLIGDGYNSDRSGSKSSKSEFEENNPGYNPTDYFVIQLSCPPEEKDNKGFE